MPKECDAGDLAGFPAKLLDSCSSIVCHPIGTLPEILTRFAPALAMLRLAKELNAAIQAGAPLAEIQKEAKFLVQTDVYPRLAELDAVIKNPARHWYRRVVDLARAAPELAANFATMPVHIALAKCLTRLLACLPMSATSKSQPKTKSLRLDCTTS